MAVLPSVVHLFLQMGVAARVTTVHSIAYFRSLTEVLNRKGPSTDLCGTPLLADLQVD